MNERKHAIIIIQNTSHEYLQYFDERWNSFLFPNCKLTDDGYEKLIIETVKNMLGQEVIVSVNYIMDKVHTKFSESAKMEKEYHHYFYKANVTNMPTSSVNKIFEINDIKFSWLSLKELENNKRIQEVNSDIVSFVKEVK